MKILKSSKFITALLIMLLFSISCSKDDSSSDTDNTPQYNEQGLQIDVKPINQDTLAVYSPTAIEIVNQSVSTNDFGTEYTLNVNAPNPEKIKKGNIIVDYTNGGRLWIIKDAPGTNRTNGIIAILGSLDTFFVNAIVEVSTPTNRAKNASSNPDKLESGKFKLYSGTDPLVTINLPNISINEESVSEGVTLSVDNNTINVALSNVQLYSNSSNTFNVTIPEGSLQVNNAIDMRYKYLPFSTALVGVPVNIGSLQEFDSSIYTTIDTNVKLDIEATTNGAINLVEPIDKELGSYTKIIPIPPYFAASVKVALKARLTVTANGQLNITPEISTKNNFEARASYDGLFSLPTFQPEYQNVETTLANSINGDFNLNQRLEIIPEVEVYAFGLLGPKGELIAYEEFNANANIQNAPITWDTQIDLGVDYNTSLDVSIFHIDVLSNSIGSLSGNIFNYDLFTSPNSSEVTLGNNQTGQVNSPLTTPIEIEVKNSNGETVAGVPIFFETTNGSFSSEYVITDAGGVAINNWTLGNNSGTQNATAFIKDGLGNIIPTTELTITATAENATTVNPANTPIPNNNATDLSLNGNLSFTEGSNTPTDATFKVYFDTNTNPTTVYNLDENTNSLSYSNLQEGTPYYWKVETISNTGSVLATSPIWSFTTITNTANTEPAFNPIPNNGANNISANGNISFTAGANTPTDATYKLYFDTNTNPTTPYNLSNQTTYNYSNLQENTTYYWKIETISNSGTILATSNIWSFTTESNTSGGIYEGNATLTTQQEVDDFGANNYSEITGNLLIGGDYANLTDITNLSSLNSITSVGGYLAIIYNPNLLNLDVLNSIIYVGSDFDLTSNDSLNDTNGLSSINFVGGMLSLGYCNSLTNIDGLSSLQTVQNHLNIRHSDFINLDGLSSLQNIGGNLSIGYNQHVDGNHSLTNLDVSGATALKHLYSYNGSLTNLNVSGTTALETLTIYSNSLTSLDISTNLALRYLYCNNNSLTSLDTSSNIDLREIECQNNSLTNFNVANGNNTVITNFSTLNNPNLTCIIVDDVAYSNANWGNIDTQTSFSTNCTPLSVTYVNHTATGNNDGTSWANAYTDLQSALANANNSGNEIWVAKGTYKPSVSDRDVSFVINNNIYGGFAGTEANLADRDISLIHTTNATILSGDLLNDDDTTVNFNDTTRDDNSKHVVEISFNNLEINGLTVKDGYADATSGDDRFGGGIFKLTTVNTTTIKNCIIKNNVAFTGAGLSLTTTSNSNITIDACIIENNLANAAAGLDFHMSASNKTMNITITNTLFKDNKTDDDASKNRKGSGASAARLRAYFAGVTLNADIVNNTFANNSSLGDIGSSVAGNFPVIDLTKNNGEWNNITVANNIFWSNVTHSNQIAKAIGKSHSLGIPLQGTDSQRLVENNTDEDNLSTFTSTPLNTSSVNPNLDSNFELTTGSPAINTGDNTYVTTTTDLLGNQRIFNTTVDRGAYEFGSAPLGINNFFVEDESSIYPNPTTSVLNIKMKNDLKQATIYSVLGAKVLETTTKTIHTSQLKPGMYLIKIESKTGNVTTKRFIKR